MSEQGAGRGRGAAALSQIFSHSWCSQEKISDLRAEHEEAVGEYGLRLSSWDQLKQLDCIILAVAHREYLRMSVPELLKPLRKQRNNVVVDVKSVLSPETLPGSVKYWRL